MLSWAAMKADDPRDKGYGKAARFLTLLGKEQAASVMKHLSEEEVAGISEEIARLDKVDSREAARILEEFGYLMKTRDLVARGGVELAERILTDAFGEERAAAMVDRIRARTAPHPFAFLMDLDIEQVRLLLRRESAPVLSVILPHLSPERAAQILESMPHELQQEVVRRMARLERISPEVLRRAEGALKEKIREQGEIVTQEIDGPEVLAEILKKMGSASESRILADLQSHDEALAAEIEKKLFTLDVLLSLTDRDLQAVLRDYSERELALLCKGLSQAQVERLKAGVSGRRWEMVQEESASLGAVFRSEVERAVEEFLADIRARRDRGDISIAGDDDQMVR